jgi:hypothetical protein
MTDVHAAHATVEAGAAIVLSLGGAVALCRAWLDRRSAERRSTARRSPSVTSGRSPGAAVRQTGRYAAVVLSSGAAAIHLAAGPAHVEEQGDVGLLFYWAAFFQAGLALTLLAGRLSPGIVRVGILGNAALAAAWAWSRSSGLPFVPGGPEAVGLVDGIALAFEIGVVAILVGWAERLDLWLADLARPADVRTAATSGLVAVVGVALLAATIALVDIDGHGHAGDGPPAAAVHEP